MPKKYVWKALLSGIVFVIITSSVGMAQQPAGGPPQAAINACRGKQDGESCSFQGKTGMMNGVCQTKGPQRVCVPQGQQEQVSGQSGQRRQQVEPYSEAIILKNRLTDTGQERCYDNTQEIACPSEGETFYGQDAQYQNQPFSYQDNDGGTVTDLNTGLMWQQAHNAERLSYYQAKEACEKLKLGGYSDWRLPAITELFSITDFRGSQANKPHRASQEPRFYLDAEVFDLAYPDESVLAGDRFGSHKVEMMGQTWSGTIYTGQHWGRKIEAAFFFNFFDGHIKQAPTHETELFYRCVRGEEYGEPDFQDHGDGTITDQATGLIWQQADDGKTRNWEEALAYCENLTLAGSHDWRLPNVKELQSLVDYSRHDPALDTGVFTQADPDGWFWSSTTHGDNINMAAYVCFGKGTSVEGVDVHGAGAQRADPKSGDPSDYTSIGAQADEVRIFNYVRCVR